MKFRLLAGQHQEADKTLPPKRLFKDPETGNVTKIYPTKTYNAGEVIESDVDLAAKYGADKYQRLDTGKVSPQQVQSAAFQGRHDRREFDDEELSQAMIANPQAKTPDDLPGADDDPNRNDDQPNVSQRTAFVDPRRATASNESDSEEEEESQSNTASEDSEWNESMTVTELKQYAKTNNIDLTGRERKSDIIQAIKQSEDSE
jgi:hypothetical protein